MRFREPKGQVEFRFPLPPQAFDAGRKGPLDGLLPDRPPKSNQRYIGRWRIQQTHAQIPSRYRLEGDSAQAGR